MNRGSELCRLVPYHLAMSPYRLQKQVAECNAKDYPLTNANSQRVVLSAMVPEIGLEPIRKKNSEGF